MKEKYIPELDLLIVRRDQAPETTEGGIFTPVQARQVLPKGTIVQVGPGRVHSGQRIPIRESLKPGVRVLFVPNQAVPLPDSEEILLPEGAILCTLEPEVEARVAGREIEAGVAS